MPDKPNLHSVGTEWKIWDLHVHTPASIVQHYGNNNDEVWERFISDLEQLPPEVKVIGINDYWFLDGYKKVLQERKAGRLQNLDAIFPVVEMRFNHFGGTAKQLSKINFHVIFDPDLEVDTIESQFLNSLQAKMKLARDDDQWSGLITKDTLRDMGQRIINSVPDDEKKYMKSPLVEGVNNLTVTQENVESALDSSFLRGRYLIAVGKTEWANIKWNKQSIASKKSVISRADLIFTAYEDTSKWLQNVNSLKEDNVNYHVIDCSDAHYFSDSTEYMRIGNCLTWLKTVPTLAGLAYALEEFDRRVYVGIEPPERKRVRKNPEHFIDRIKISSDSPENTLFDYDIPLNSGFVAVVGNKGQGKSAMLDCIALAGNSSRNKEFAFLCSSRFLSARNKKNASNYSSKIRWVTGVERTVQLDREHDPAFPVSVEYLPQAFVERVCSVDPSHANADDFERELRDVLFTHIPEKDRAGENSFDDLLVRITEASNNNLSRLRTSLREIVEKYASLNRFLYSNLETDISSKIALKEREIERAENELNIAKEALESFDSQNQRNEELLALSSELNQMEESRIQVSEKHFEATRRQTEITKSLASVDALMRQADHLRTDALSINQRFSEIIGRSSDPIVEVVIRSSLYQAWAEKQRSLRDSFALSQEDADKELTQLDERRKKLTQSLAATDSVRERLRQQIIQQQERISMLNGDEKDVSSYKGLVALHSKVQSANREISITCHEILDLTRLIYRQLQTQLAEVSSMYAPASSFISSSEVASSAGLKFGAELRLLSSWEDTARNLDGRRNGQFLDWLEDFSSALEDTSWDQISSYLRQVFSRLEHEKGAPEAARRNPETALKQSVKLEDFLYSIFSLEWLDVRFRITGEGQPLSQLSPGQRGLVLALFYLVVDQRTTPLLLDQPEENLDNATIASKLVPAIHEAAGRRQTIVVTHNANLAIVGDADQVIHCQMVDSKFRVSSGSIAELDIAQFALDVLEGTKPAFDNRRHKYEAFPDLK